MPKPPLREHRQRALEQFAHQPEDVQVDDGLAPLDASSNGGSPERAASAQS